MVPIYKSITSVFVSVRLCVDAPAFASLRTLQATHEAAGTWPAAEKDSLAIVCRPAAVEPDAL